jgi:pimeloyl-ACP methyl ester carboxylesterase
MWSEGHIPMATARVNGVDLSYRQVGTGPDVVFIHGLGANQAFWNLELVAALARSYRVTTYDLRGHGYSQTRPDGYQPEQAAADLRGLLDQLAVEQVHCVGHSYGGLVALRFALAEPARVLTVTVADTRIRSLQPRQALSEAPDWPRLRDVLGRNGVVIDEDEPEIGFMLFEALASPQWEKARQRTAATSAFVPFGGAGTRSAQRWLNLLKTTSVKSDYRTGADIPTEQLIKLHQPLLGVYGQNSPNRWTGEQLGALLPSCRSVLVPGAGHFHPATNARFFREALQTFLEVHA